MAFTILVEAAVIMLVLSIFDYMFQRRQHREQLKMTKQEVKEERKTYEGDPQIKSRLRERMRELASRNQMQNVPNADVVVTNPTHYAVAMEYKRMQMAAPTVTAKGADNIALRIREMAQESEVPVIENRPLARALYSEVEIGDEIPEKYYEAVVAVLKQVYRMTGKRMEAV
jgi:flagellar biosynthetic protein FlhB